MNTVGPFFTFTRAKEISGESCNLITFLVRDRQIPYLQIGRAKVFDQAGLDRLLEEIAAYHAKPASAVRASA